MVGCTVGIFRTAVVGTHNFDLYIDCVMNVQYIMSQMRAQ